MGQEEKTALFEKYQCHLSSSLSNVSSVDGWYTSKLNDMTLDEFVVARQEYCQCYHTNSCTECTKLISAAKYIAKEKVDKLQKVHEKHFLKQGSRYKTDTAVKQLMQLPVVAFPVKEHERVILYVTELEGLNCSKAQRLTQNLLAMQKKESSELNKATLSLICDLVSSEADKKLIKYTALLSSGISSTQARKLYGILECSGLNLEVV